MARKDTIPRATCDEARKSYPLATDEEPNHELPPPVDSDDGQFEVERLVERKRVGRGFKYWVKWRGYPDSENSWVHKKDIHPGIVAAFEAGLLVG